MVSCTFIDGHVHPTQALLLVAVHVISEGVSCLLACFYKSPVERMVGLSSGHVKRPTASSVPVERKEDIGGHHELQPSFQPRAVVPNLGP